MIQFKINNKLKGIEVKNRTYYFFDEIKSRYLKSQTKIFLFNTLDKC